MKIRIYCLLLLLFVLFQTVCAQTTIKGVVKEISTSLPISDAVVFVKDHPWDSRTNEKGEYTITLPDSMLNYHLVLVAHKLRYLDAEKDVTIIGAEQNVEFILSKELSLGQVTVTAQQMVTISKGIKVDRATLNMNSTDVSISSALRGTSGTQVENRGEGLLVRGGQGSETGFTFDGISILDFYTSSANGECQFSRFQVAVFENAEYSAGGFSAENGQYMSAMVNLESSSVPLLRKSLEITLSSIYQNIDYSKRLGKNTIWLGGSYSDLSLSKQLFSNKSSYAQFDTAPKSFIGYFMFTHTFNRRSSLNLYTDVNLSKYTVHYPSLTDFSSRVENHQRGKSVFSKLSFRHKGGHSKLLTSGGVQYINNMDREFIPGSWTNIGKGIDLQGQGHLDYSLFTKRSTLSFGGDYIYRRNKSYGEETLENHYVGLYAEANCNITKGLNIMPNARWEYNSVIRKHIFLPRLNLVYDYNRLSAHLDWGEYAQVPQYSFLRYPGKLTYEKAFHHILTVDYNDISCHDLFLSGSLYYKRYTDLITYQEGENNDLSLSNGGDGYAAGFDQSVEYTRLFGGTLKLGYSILSSKWRYEGYKERIQPTFVANHILLVKYLKFFSPISTYFNLQYSFSSGRKYQNPYHTDMLTTRLRDYHDVSLTIAHLARVMKMQTVWVVSFRNMLNFKNENDCMFTPDRIIKSQPILNRMIYVGVILNINHKSKKQIEKELFGEKTHNIN